MSKPTTRRAVLAGAAAIPALAMPAIAGTEPDPIFAVIERHKAAWNAYSDAVARDEDHALCSRADAVAMELFSIQPTTVAGVIRLLSYTYQHESDEPQGWPQFDAPRASVKLPAGFPAAKYGDMEHRPWQHFICFHAARSLAAIVERGVS